MAEKTAAEPVEVITLAEYWERVQRGVQIKPGTLILLPVETLLGVLEHLDELQAACVREDALEQERRQLTERLLARFNGKRDGTSHDQRKALCLTDGEKQSCSSSGEVVEIAYVGTSTKGFLLQVQQGTESLATFKRSKRLLGHTPGDTYLSLDEVINVLERRAMVQKSADELRLEIETYQTGIAMIEREPDAYVAPDAARAWYEQEIARVSSLLSEVEVQA